MTKRGMIEVEIEASTRKSYRFWRLARYSKTSLSDPQIWMEDQKLRVDSALHCAAHSEQAIYHPLFPPQNPKIL